MECISPEVTRPNPTETKTEERRMLATRVVAPTGRDAELIVGVLGVNGVAARVCEAHCVLEEGADCGLLGPVLIAEEALTPALIAELGDFRRTQEAWSDLPVLILTSGGRETFSSRQMQAERQPLGSPVLLERPIRTATLVSSVQAALRARERQFEIRNAFLERDRAVEELRAEQETLRAVLDNVPVGIVLSKPSGEIVMGNQRVEALLRHPVLRSKDVEAHGDWVAFHADGRRVLGEEYPLARAMQSGEAIAAEDYLYQRGDGTQAWVSLSAAPVRNAEGAVTGGVVAIADIDQQKRAEAALIQNEKLAAVGRLAASISHEINNPLEAMTNLLYLVRQDTLPVEAKQYLEAMDGELRRVTQIVSQTLRFHRQSTRPRELTAGELMEPPLGLYRGRLQNSGIELKLRDRSEAKVNCFEGEIRQVLNNLIGNAIDAMRTGGRLLIRMSDGVAWKTGQRGVRISVADNGHGMSAEVARRIFEPFYTTKGINGTGLGLWISQGILLKHHGSIRVRSSQREGRSGTVFCLFLPVGVAPEVADASQV